MATIKTYEQFVNESRGYDIDVEKTYQEIISNMRPGDALTVYFPEDFELEYEKGHGQWAKRGKFICNMLKLWYWDESDHQTLDYYFHTPDKHHWVCKIYDLTEESYGKVKDYLRTNTYSENEKYVNDPRNQQ